jgi:hypothetical protein
LNCLERYVAVRFVGRNYDDDGSFGGGSDVSRVAGGTAMASVIIVVAGIVGAKLEQQHAGKDESEKRRTTDLAERQHLWIEYNPLSR